MTIAAATDAEDPALPAARRRMVIIFVAMTGSIAAGLPIVFLMLYWPGIAFAVPLILLDLGVLALHSWWFRRSLRHPKTRPPQGYLVLAAILGTSLLCLGMFSSPLGSIWAFGPALLLGDSLTRRDRRTVIASVTGAVLAAFGIGVLLAPQPPGGGPNWASAAIAAAYMAVLWTASFNRVYWLGSMNTLDTSRRMAIELATARERLRLADDLHDILGHALEVVAFKSELAGKLLPAEAVRARGEIDEVARVARDAMSEVRALSRDRRSTTLTAELAGAQATLGSADIELSVTGDPAQLPEESQDILGRVLREAMTNLLRHSNAAHCSVLLGYDTDIAELRVTNDGVPATESGPDTEGTGLAGLRRYLNERRGRLTAGPGHEGTFTVHAELPVHT
ncbi:sensor histidine kinase [Sciscionella sediminilitoris]|uniref:sensor histidine kinase n=1 Tax=Sciscionella sediminilitoris TaxID=1445613 RepID=UPI00068ACC2E|nr:histidine kinase [Sciscionella sp. SE31]